VPRTPGSDDHVLVTITVFSSAVLHEIVRGANDIVRAMRDAPAGAPGPVRMLFEHGLEKWHFPDVGGQICHGQPGRPLAALTVSLAELTTQDQLWRSDLRKRSI
jgi:hypothetical protein